MKVIITVSKDTDYERIDQAVKDSNFEFSEVISFGASAVEEWAMKNGIPVRVFAADRPIYGERAEIVRDARVSGYADALITIGEDKDIENIIEDMQALKKPVYVGK